MQVKNTITLELEKPELMLITKALVGKLRPEEVQQAKELGLRFLEAFSAALASKAEAAAHALGKAKEP